MDLRQLRYFVAVAEELNFSQAARRLHMSQPPLSLHIKAIESELGTRLLERNRRNVSLTEPGRLFLQRARVILSQMTIASDEVRRAARGEAGELRIAFTGSAPMFAPFPRLLQTFREQHPGVEVTMSQMSTAMQLRALSEGRIDAGFLRPSHDFVPGPNIVVRTVWQDELMAVLPSAHRLARRRAPMTMQDLTDEPFVLFSQDLGCGLRDHIVGLCSQAGFSPRVVQEAREGVTILALVAAGTGVTLMPQTYRNAGIAGIAYRSIASAASSSRLLMASPAEAASPTAERFLAMACAWPEFASSPSTGNVAG